MKSNPEAIRKLRMEKGLSVEDLATKSGVSERTIRSAEQGGHFHIRTLQRVATGLSVGYTLIIGHDADDEEEWALNHVSSARSDFTKFTEFFLRKISRTSPIDELILAFNLAANRTLAYSYRVGNDKSARNLDEEVRLSDLWLLVGASLSAFSKHAEETLNTIFLYKARYWASVDCWTDEQICDAGIELAPLIAAMDAKLVKLRASASSE